MSIRGEVLKTNERNLQWSVFREGVSSILPSPRSCFNHATCTVCCYQYTMSTPHPNTREMGGRRKSSSSSSKRSKKTTFNFPRAPGIQTPGQASGVPYRSSLDSNDEEVGFGSASSASTSTRMARRSSLHIPKVAESSTPTHRVWRTMILWSVGILDFGLGMSFIVYGALVHDVVTVMAVAVTYGILLLFGSIAGAFSSGNRMCYLTSAIVGFLTFLLDIGALIAILVSWETLIVFLNINHEHLMLSESLVKSMQSHKVLIAVIFAVLAVLELVRGCVLWDITKTNTVSPAPAGSPHNSFGNRSIGSGGSVGSQSHRSSGSKKKANNWFLSLFGRTKRKKVDDMIMFHDNTSIEAPLLWSSDQRTEPSADDYLNFIPQHEKRIANYSHVELPLPPADRTDY